MSEWIRANEQLPEVNQRVWVVYSHVVQYVAYVLCEGVWESAIDAEADTMPFSFVTHWMPLPEPPDE